MNKKTVFISITAIFICLCLTLGLYTLLRPAREFSARENRALASFPSFSVSALLDGSYTKDIGTYFADQFAARDLSSQINLTVKRLLGQKESGGVYLGKNDQLYLIPDTPDMTKVEKNVSAVNKFASAFPKVNSYFCIVENAVCLQGQNLPKNAPVPEQDVFLASIEEQLQGVKMIDVNEKLKSENEKYIFYLTDHHWTSLGAKIAFEEVAGDMGIKNIITEYKVLPFGDEFFGTLSSKSGCYTVGDTVEVYLPETDLLYSVEYVDTLTKTTTIFDNDAISVKDKYTVFFGGNHPRVDITTTADTGRSLLVFKDSYFNSFAQFIWPYFEKIVIVDPRYYYEYAGDIVKQENITDILYLYNADTFGTDSSLYAVLEAPEN